MENIKRCIFYVTTYIFKALLKFHQNVSEQDIVFIYFPEKLNDTIGNLRINSHKIDMKINQSL